MNRSLLALLCAVGLVLTGCDEGAAGLTGPSETTTASADGASLTNYDMAFYVQNGASTLYFVPSNETSSTPLITCSVSGASPHLVRVNVTQGSAGNADCDGQIPRDDVYLVYAHGQTNGATINVPLQPVGQSQNISGNATLSSAGAWSDNGSWYATSFDIVARNVTFTFPPGLYSTVEYHSFWEPVWNVGQQTHELPAVSTKIRLTYTNSSGSTSNLTVFNGVGTYTDGTWSAQGGTTGTIRATDNVTGAHTYGSFSIAGGGGGEPPCRFEPCA